MCGIAGLWSSAFPADRLQATAVAMAATLSHRGPDDSGVWVSQEDGLALSHRRLSIIDLSPAGHQPMASADRGLILVLNGEIYNHLSLRRELDAAGLSPPWRGHSDTETLLAAFAAWGFEMALGKAVGMFALALWDNRTSTLRLARDRTGEKPLYYGWAGGALGFASELKALRAIPGFDNPVNRGALALYMQFCAVPAPLSIHEGIFKLEPGSTVTLTRRDMSARMLPPPVEYWRAPDVARVGLSRPIIDDAEAVDGFEAVLRNALQGQAAADVPVGAFLSGGIDSSTIVALLQSQLSTQVQTYTIGFDELGFDESASAAAIARHLGTRHHEIRIGAADAISVIPRLPAIYDEPFADSSQIATFLVAQAASRDITVALCGDGADELFGGYNRYLWSRRLWRQFGWIPDGLRTVLGSGLRSISPSYWDWIAGLVRPNVHGFGEKTHKLARRFENVSNIDDLYRSLLTEWPSSSAVVLGAPSVAARIDDPGNIAGIADPVQRMMLLDLMGYLPDDILTKVDRAAMASSVETRVPFLDHNVVEFAWRLPMDKKIRGGKGKWVMRQMLAKYVPPHLNERPKSGFGVPLGKWLLGPLRDWAEELLAEPRLLREGYFDPASVRRKWAEHKGGHHDWSQSLWCVLMFQAWLDHNRLIL